MRGLAIALVMALHFVPPDRTATGLDRLLIRLSGYGLWGVDLFFVLSGFLITGILYDAKGSRGFFANFYMRRTLRIFPLYYGVLFVLLVLVPRSWLARLDPALLETRQAAPWLWTYLTNFHLADAGDFAIPYVSHFWSLAVEEHFYLFWPFLVSLLSRVNAMRACLAFALVALSLRVALVLGGASAIVPQLLTPCRLDTLCLGSFFALALRGPSREVGGRSLTAAEVWQRRARAGFVPSALAVVLLSVLHKLFPAWDPLVIELRASALALFFAVMVVCAAGAGGQRWLKAAFRIGWLRMLGKYSYGLYVFHGIIAYGFFVHGSYAWFRAHVGSFFLAALAQTAVGVTLSLAISVLSYELYEVKFLKLKKLFRSERTPVEEKAAAPKLSEEPSRRVETHVPRERPAAELVARGRR